MKNRTYWELGIDKGDSEGTETIETFNLLSDAINALLNINDRDKHFIDLWEYSTNSGIQLDQCISGKELTAILNGTFTPEEDYDYVKNIFIPLPEPLSWNSKQKNIGSVTCHNDIATLEIIECNCGLHIGMDITYLEQVESTVRIICPSCQSTLTWTEE